MSDKKISKDKVVEHINKQSKKNFTNSEYNNLIDNLFVGNEDYKNVATIKKASKFTYDEENTTLISSDTSLKERICRNFLVNFSLMAKTFTKKFFTSGVLLAFLVIPILFGTLLINNLMNKSFDSNYDYATFANTFIDPLLVITLMFIPSFILSIRSDALIKRLRIYGVTKEQFNFSVSIMTLLLTLLVMLIIMVPLTEFGNLIFNALNHDNNKDLKFNLTGINWGILLPLLIFSILSFTQFGIFLGMKSKGAISSIIGGYGIIFLIQFLTSYSQGGWYIINKKSNALYYFLEVMWWMFCITPFTIVVKGITLCFHHKDSILIGQYFKDSYQLRVSVWFVSYILTISTIITSIIFNNKLIKFNGLR